MSVPVFIRDVVSLGSQAEFYTYSLPHGALPASPTTDSGVLSGTAAAFLSRAFCATYDTLGNCFVLCGPTPAIVKITPGGTLSVFLSTSVGHTRNGSIGIDSSGNVYVVNSSNKAIISMYTSSGAGPTTFCTASYQNQWFVVDGYDNVIAVDVGPSGMGRLVKYAAGTGVPTVLNSVMYASSSYIYTADNAICLDSSGNIYVAWNLGGTGANNYNGIAQFGPTGTLLNLNWAQLPTSAQSPYIIDNLAYDPAAQEVYATMTVIGAGGDVFVVSSGGSVTKFASPVPSGAYNPPYAYNFPVLAGPRPTASGGIPPAWQPGPFII